MSEPLYVLTGQFAEVQARAEAGEDVAEALEKLSGDIEAKGAALVRVLRDLELDSDKCGEEIKRLSARKKAIDGNVERIREYVRQAMEQTGIHRIKAATFAITLTQAPERVVVQDEALVPLAYLRTRTEIDKSKILAAYKEAGECVPGTCIERGSCLRIR